MNRDNTNKPYFTLNSDTLQNIVSEPVVILTILIFTLCGLLCSCSDGYSYGRDTDKALATLDSTLIYHNDYVIKKQTNINRLRSDLTEASTTRRYDICDSLYSEYYSFDFDSAVAYAWKKIEAAKQLHDRRKTAIGYLNLARAELAIGNETETLNALATAISDTTDRDIHRMYCDTQIAYCEFKKNDQLHLRQEIKQLLDSGNCEWIYNESNLRYYNGQLPKALAILDSNNIILSASERNRGISNFLRGRILLELGDTIKAIEAMTKSAASDLRTPVRDYRSLFELASLLFAKGDIERAYRYITFAVEDANASKAIDNIVATNKIMPEIVYAYEQQREMQYRRQQLFIIGIAILALMLLCSVGSLVKSKQRLSHYVRNIQQLNKQLETINSDLQITVAELNESNKVKDAYLAQYLKLCSYYIDCVEKLKAGITSAARTKGTDGVIKILETSTRTDRELKQFYANFDQTFLQLFPTFIDKFNTLLAEDKHITPNPDGSMPTELRVFALIRLGITDSEQIAFFLRRSLSTIYNYRVKMRNAAICPREKFEDEIAKIQ